jgi:carbon monoxide dehydrogenase subunit G
MQLAGKHVVNAHASKIWTMLMDMVTLAKIVPGISSLEKKTENSYVSTFSIKMGPVSGSFAGNLQMDDIREQKGFTLNIHQNSKIGNAKAAIKVDLCPLEDNKTEVAFDGDAKLSGLLAGIGQRVLSGVAHTMSKQFFINLENELSASKNGN